MRCRRWTCRSLLPLLVGLVMAHGGCQGSEDDTTLRFVPPDEPGSKLAGTLAEMFTYYPEVGSATELTVPVQVWYPVSTGVEELHHYDVLSITTGQAVDRGPADCSQARPVVLFSHGYSGLGYQTYTLSEHLARHGYLVAAPDHAFNTVFDLDEDREYEVALRRPLDIRATYDWLADWAAELDSPLAGCVDPEAGYAVVGHSFGAWTALAVAGATLDLSVVESDCEGQDIPGCEVVRATIAAHPGQPILDESDPRIWAAVSLAPGFSHVFGSQGLAAITVPTMVVGGELDETCPWDDDTLPSYQGLITTPRYLAGLAGAGHFSFTDFCDIMLLVGEEGDGCGEGFRPVDEVLQTLRVLALAFLQSVRGYEQAHNWLPPAEGLSHWEVAE